jgi:hypothetical protein
MANPARKVETLDKLVLWCSNKIEEIKNKGLRLILRYSSGKYAADGTGTGEAGKGEGRDERSPIWEGRKRNGNN